MLYTSICTNSIPTLTLKFIYMYESGDVAVPSDMQTHNVASFSPAEDHALCTMDGRGIQE